MFTNARSISSIPLPMFDPLSGSATLLVNNMFNMNETYPLTGSITFCTGSVNGNNISGTVKDIWNFTSSSGWTTTNMFNNCLGITNYSSIPAGWK